MVGAGLGGLAQAAGPRVIVEQPIPSWVCMIPADFPQLGETCWPRAQVAALGKCGPWIHVRLVRGWIVSAVVVQEFAPWEPPGSPGQGRVVYVTGSFADGFEPCP